MEIIGKIGFTQILDLTLPWSKKDKHTDCENEALLSRFASIVFPVNMECAQKGQLEKSGMTCKPQWGHWTQKEIQELVKGKAKEKQKSTTHVQLLCVVFMRPSMIVCERERETDLERVICVWCVWNQSDRAHLEIKKNSLGKPQCPTLFDAPNAPFTASATPEVWTHEKLKLFWLTGFLVLSDGATSILAKKKKADHCIFDKTQVERVFDKTT